jgi:hypothetical protein
VDIPSSRRTTPVKEKFVDVSRPATAEMKYEFVAAALPRLGGV